MNIEDYSHWKSIQMDFIKFEAKYFTQLSNITLKVFRNYYYLHGLWIELNPSLDKTFNTPIVKVVHSQVE